MDVRSSFQYCVNRVRQHDYENYLSTFALPPHHRPAALAVRAFNVETAQALGATKEPHLALMRLKWWRDSVAAIHAGKPGEVPQHPVAIALSAAIHGSGARVKRWLEQIVEARIKDAEMPGSPPGIPALEAYANNTASTLLYLLLDLSDVRNTEADHAAAHLGKAIGIANLLRGTHAHSAQRRCYVPVDVCARHGVSTEDVYRARPTEELRNAIHEVASVAKSHLDSARAMAPRLVVVAGTGTGAGGAPPGNNSSSINKGNGEGKRGGGNGGGCGGGGILYSERKKPPATAAAVLLPAVATGAYLEALEAKDFDVFHPELVRGNPPLVTQARIAWAAYKGEY